MNIIRFIERPVEKGAVSRMEEHPEGPWIRYDDVEHLIEKEKAREYINSIP